MIKLPEKKYEPKHNDELREYASGWNSAIEAAEYLYNEYVLEYAKKVLLEEKEFAYELADEYEVYKGAYDCLVEIERLNEEPEHRLDNFFKDSLDALDKLNIRGE